jgi:hypothetical protein
MSTLRAERIATSCRGRVRKNQSHAKRFLFLLLLLRHPRARLIYVTPRTILPSIIDYYLDLLPGVMPSHTRQRLFLAFTHGRFGASPQ